MHCVSRGGCYLLNSHCDLQEDNRRQRESYEACWLSLVLETRPQYKLTLSETDSVRRESYKQQQVVHFMVERSPSQTLRLGSDGTAMSEHRLPFFYASRDPQRATAASGCAEQQLLTRVDGKNGSEEQEVTAITQDLRKTVRENFRASSLVCSPGEVSHRAQRRE